MKAFPSPRLFLLPILCATAAFTVQAQNISGTISGTVHDPSGASVPNATVTITNTDRRTVLRTVPADAQGVYTAPQLPIGHYTVTVEANGFQKSTVQDITLNVNDVLNISPTMSVGSATQSVTVNAAALQVDTESSAGATLIDPVQIAQLPLNTRNYEQLVQLQPGVSYGGGDQLYVGLSNPFGGSNNVNFSINGQRSTQNNWTVDGADNVDRGSNGTLLVYPSVDAIAEFKTLRNTYSAEFGRSASGQINVATKSGSHDFHGSAYEFFRNDVLNANSSLNKHATPIIARPEYRYNNFGYSVGGPVWIPKIYNTKRDKTFFFFSHEFRRVIVFGGTNLTGDPTAAERAGVFPNSVCLQNGCTGGSTNVPVSSATAKSYLKDVIGGIPLPNSSTDPNGLISSTRSTYNFTQEIARIDHNFSDKLAVFFRFENDDIPTTEPGGLFSGSGFPGVGVTSTNAPGRTYLGHLTWTISPTLIFDGGYAYASGAIISQPIGSMARGNSPDVQPTLPFISTLTRIPALTFQGGTSLTSFGPYDDHNRDHNLFLNLSKIVDQQSLRFGITYHHYEKTENAGGNNAGTFAFAPNGGADNSAGIPVGSSASNFEQSFANFLQGNVTSFTQASFDVKPDITTNQAEGYFQDDWRVTHQLTLNMGMRYSWFQQPIDNNHLLTNFDPTAYDPALAPTIDNKGNICQTAPCAGGVTPNAGANALNGLQIANQGSRYGSRVAPQAWLDFGPRFGFAYDVFGNGKTAIRGGYGLAYDSTAYGNYEDNIFSNPPYVSSINIPITGLDNPAAGSPSISSLPKTLTATPYTQYTPYGQNFSLGVQQEFAPNLIGEVTYVGTNGRHLLGLADINEARPGAYLALGIPAGGVTRSNTQLLNQIRPYRGYGPINAAENWFGSNYSGVQSSLRKRFHEGSSVNVNYTYSKAMTNAQADRTAIQNVYSLPGDYGLSSLDRRHVLSVDFLYSLPFYREQHGFTGEILGGWQFAGIVNVNSGLPLTPSTSQDPAGLGLLNSASDAGARPNQVANPMSGAPRSWEKWFNTAAFANVPAGEITPGNASPGAIRAPGYQRWDLSFYKNFNFFDRAKLQFRTEAFNVWNHTNFDTVSTSLTSSQYGQVTGVRDPRLLQLALKVTF